jgi:hypothetical protein
MRAFQFPRDVSNEAAVIIIAQKSVHNATNLADDPAPE